jgi:hypothetical protein
MTDSRKMTLTQLLHLVDRARRGVILPPELDDLHGGIVALDAARRSAGGLQRSLHDARAERDKAQATLAAVREVANRLGGPWHGTLLAVIDAPDPAEALRAMTGECLPPAPTDRTKEAA